MWRPGTPIAAAVGTAPPSLEIAQVGRRLVLAGGHQQPAGGEVIVLGADPHLRLQLAPDALEPDRMALAPVAALHAPRAGQSIVVHRDIVMEDVGLGGIEMHPLL